MTCLDCLKPPVWRWSAANGVTFAFCIAHDNLALQRSGHMVGSIYTRTAIDAVATVAAPAAPTACTCARDLLYVKGCSCPGGKAELDKERAKRRAREISRSHY